MSKNNPEINKFLENAKADAQQSGEICDVVAFDDFWTEKYSADDTSFNYRAFLGDAAVFTANNQISYYKELTSYKKGISVIVLPIKRVIRKLVAFLFLPLVAEQNEVNLSAARIVEHLRSYVNKDAESRNQRTKREMELDQEIRTLKEQIAELTKKVEELSENKQTEK